MDFECVSRTDVGLRRKINEDALIECSERGYWAVADGMGGHQAGDVASARVIAALAAIAPGGTLEQLVDRSVAALGQVNRELIVLARDMQARTIGSTVVGVAIAGDEYRCYWVGDSRAYRIRGRRLERLTRDHSLVQQLVDAGELRPDEAERHPNSNIVTRAVGVAETLRVDVRSGDVRRGDQFLLASDGLTRVVDDEQLLDELSGRPIEQAADRLIEIVLSRGAPDNVSLVIARVV